MKLLLLGLAMLLLSGCTLNYTIVVSPNPVSLGDSSQPQTDATTRNM